MSERWEQIAESEILFYLRFQEFEEEIRDLIYENEANIQLPVTHFDSVEGRVFRYCPGTEEQALRRIERREVLQSALARGLKRKDRFLSFYNTLTEEEKDVIYYTYFEKRSNRDFKFLLELRSVKDVPLLKRKVLKKLYSLYEKERAERDSERKRLLQQERKEKADRLRKMLGVVNM